MKTESVKEESEQSSTDQDKDVYEYGNKVFLQADESQSQAAANAIADGLSLPNSVDHETLHKLAEHQRTKKRLRSEMRQKVSTFWPLVEVVILNLLVFVFGQSLLLLMLSSYSDN